MLTEKKKLNTEGKTSLKNDLISLMIIYFYQTPPSVSSVISFIIEEDWVENKFTTSTQIKISQLRHHSYLTTDETCTPSTAFKVS